ncbi:MAG: carbohydrate kinase family protein [Aigarchaeota archaeon]|nr:carbohydrate kinase family protein [Candidatus Pelearchaeum maunauluense]
MPEGRVICVGDLNLDIIAFHDEMPKLGGESLASRAYVSSGGSAANVAHALRLLGLSSELVSCVGMDIVGEFLVDELRKAGVGTRYIQKTEKESTGVVYVVVSRSGERTMLAYRGANKHLTHASLPKDIASESALIHISGYCFLEEPQKSTAEYVMGEADKHGIPKTLDLCIPLIRSGEQLDELLRSFDYVFMNEEEASELLVRLGVTSVGEAALSIGSVFVLKRGSRGCSIVGKSGVIDVPTASIKPVDTTGSGDAFAAGFIYGIITSLSLERCATLANRLGGLAAATIGGRLKEPPRIDDIVTQRRRRSR